MVFIGWWWWWWRWRANPT